METIFRDENVSHLESNNLISLDQDGFKSGRSCITQLMENVYDWVDSLEGKQSVDVVYLDYKKAFDSVPLERLLVKLMPMEIKDVAGKEIPQTDLNSLLGYSNN